MANKHIPNEKMACFHDIIPQAAGQLTFLIQFFGAILKAETAGLVPAYDYRVNSSCPKIRIKLHQHFTGAQ